MLEKSKFEREIDEILGKTDVHESINTGATEKSRQASIPKVFDETFSGAAPKRSPKKTLTENQPETRQSNNRWYGNFSLRSIHSDGTSSHHTIRHWIISHRICTLVPMTNIDKELS